MSTLDCGEILRTLPHRYPFLLVDRVLECDDAKHIVAIKNVTINEPFFQGHFPGNPVMPGVLQLECMAQVAGILILRIRGSAHKVTPYFMAIDKVKFRRVVQPGDQLRIEVDILRLRPSQSRFFARCLVNDQVASEAEMLCMIREEAADASGSAAV